MSIAVRDFGEFEGKRVSQFTLTSPTGVEVDIIDYGVAVRDWRVPVAGGMRSVVLGFDNFPAYAAHSPHLNVPADAPPFFLLHAEDDGGEELVALFEQHSLAQAEGLMELWRCRLSELKWREKGMRVTFSAGIGESQGRTPEALMTLVDKAMYQAKRAGKNRIHRSEE